MATGMPLSMPERDKPLLLVGKPIVLKRERRSRENLRRINEVQTVGFQIGFAPLFIPLVPHLRSVYTILIPRKKRRGSKRFSLRSTLALTSDIAGSAQL
jgi:hypothetical protein